jgi:hypothetical protein
MVPASPIARRGQRRYPVRPHCDPRLVMAWGRYFSAGTAQMFSIGVLIYIESEPGRDDACYGSHAIPGSKISPVIQSIGSPWLAIRVPIDVGLHSVGLSLEWLVLHGSTKSPAGTYIEGWRSSLFGLLHSPSRHFQYFQFPSLEHIRFTARKF